MICLSLFFIFATARLGELIEQIPDFHSSGKGTMKRKDLPVGVDKKFSHYFITSPELLSSQLEIALDESHFG